MWQVPLIAGAVVLVLGLAIAAYADQVSSRRARVYGEPERPPGSFVTRGGILALIGALEAGLAFTRT